MPWLGSVVAILLVLADPAAAELRVENAGQPAMFSTVPQPPLVVSARGSCADVYDAPEANGEGGTCGFGAWPGPGGDWRPVLEVAAGDRLLVHSGVALESVEVAATTNFPPGLRTPVPPPPPGGGPAPPPGPNDGQLVRNETEFGPVLGEPTDAGQMTHAVTLPPVLARAGNGLAFAIVTTAADGSRRHYALSIQAPRKDRYGDPCSIAWFAPDFRIRGCGFKAPPSPLNMSPAPLAAAPRAPTLARTARRIGRKLRVRVRAAQNGSVRAVFAGRRSAWTAVRAGRWRVVRVPLRAGRRLPRRVTVRVTLRTATGTVAVRRRLVVRGVR